MMTSMIDFYKKHQEAFLYLIVGGLTTIVNWGTYAVLVQLGVEINISNIISWIVGVTFAFVMNKWFVFRSRCLIPLVVLRELGSFFAARIFTGAIAIILFPIVYALGMDQTILGIDGFVAKMFTTVIEIILNWIFSKFLIFDLTKKLNGTEEDNNQDEPNL